MRPTPGGAALVSLLVWLAVLAAPAAAQTTQPRLVTIAARSCPTYDSITANRARNNIMESLEDLGADTPYGSNGLPLLVQPGTEAAVQPLCTGIDNWQFTLGTGIQTRAVDGVWGSLSKVTGPFSPTIVTQPSIPLLDSHGLPTGSTISGATTITLTEAQRQLASATSKLWIQGGTPTVPITDSETYGFGALRCATDNLNGDNVEWISYPPDTTHVFCFAYYVKPAPTSGTITVRKAITVPPGSAASQKVRFTGDISYANQGEFYLTATPTNPGEQSFIRASGRSWSFTEDELPLARLTAIDCVSANGKSVSTTNVTTRATSVALAAGDHVTCTYRNTYRLPPAGLSIRKISLGGVGRFDFELTDSDGNVVIDDAEARTTSPGVAALAEPADDIADLPAGTYDVEEGTPPDVGGTWELENVNCLPHDALERSALRGSGAERAVQRTQITTVQGESTVCTFTNRFTPAGHIILRKTTLGATASTRFQVRPEFGETRPEREQHVTTTEEGVPVTADGDDLSELPVGEYSIQETVGGPDRWQVASVLCDGRPVPSEGGRFLITLTDGDPLRTCTVTNRRIDPIIPPEPPVPPPVEPPAPPVEVPPQGGVAGENVAAPVANLVVRKIVRPRRVRIGQKLHYLLTVVNRGPDPAADVTLAEQGKPVRKGVLPLRTNDGTCRSRPPRFCRFGTLDPGERATLRVDVTTRRIGRFVNRVAVNTSTAQRTRRNKRARAVAFVLPLPQPQFTG